MGSRRDSVTHYGHPMTERTIGVTELALRDAHQSLMATRMATEDMVGACAAIDRAGYWSAECWGGATFDSCIRFLNEDPWERLRTFKKLLPNTRTQMLLRGQNLLGYRHYADDVVDRFVEKAAVNGMDVFRVFDALNDPRNLERAIKAVQKSGKHAQGTICYTISPVHDIDNYVRLARQLRDMGVDSIALKDMAALLKPQPAADIVAAIKEEMPDMTVAVHCHSTTGVTLVSLWRAVESGADLIDTAISSMSLGPGHNPTESFQEVLEGTEFKADLDKEALHEIRDHFAEVRPRYAKFESKFTVDTDIFESQIPGGMLSNLESQLVAQGAGDKVVEVLKEVPKVRAASGYPPLVTPTSQIVGTQAVFNVLMGEWKTMTGEFADMVLGYYGKTEGETDPMVIEKAAKQTGKEKIECRPADLIPNEWDNLRAEAEKLEGFDGSDEDVLTYALFPMVAPVFFKNRKNGPQNVSQSVEELEAERLLAAGDNGTGTVRIPITYDVTIGDKTHTVSVKPAEK